MSMSNHDLNVTLTCLSNSCSNAPLLSLSKTSLTCSARSKSSVHRSLRPSTSSTSCLGNRSSNSLLEQKISSKIRCSLGSLFKTKIKQDNDAQEITTSEHNLEEIKVQQSLFT